MERSKTHCLLADLCSSLLMRSGPQSCRVERADLRRLLGLDWRVDHRGLWLESDRILRAETCSNDTDHFGVGRRVENLPLLRAKLAATNHRSRALQAELLASPVDTGQLAGLAQPTLVGQRRIPGLKLHDDRVIRLPGWTEPVVVNFWAHRMRVPPFGLKGGAEASPSRVFINDRELDRQEFLTKTEGFPLVGDATVCTADIAGGGGFGDPRRRQRELVLDDLRNALVSLESAARDYGFIDPDHA